MGLYASAMASVRSVIAYGVGAFVLLALAIGLISFSFGHPDTTWTPWPTRVVFDWVLSVAPRYRLLAAAVLGCCGGAMAVATVRRYKAS
jgi:hypothetical protein